MREAASRGGQHRRTPGAVADLALGLRYFLLFASEIGALEDREAENLWLRGWRTLCEVAAQQSHHQAAGDPTRRFGELLGAAVASGAAHVATLSGVEPETPGRWGWRISGDEWRPQGARLGWLDGEDLYLEPDASYAAAQKQGRDSGDAPSVTLRTLKKRLDERGLLRSKDDGRQVLTVRRAAEGSRRNVLHVASDLLTPPASGPDRPDHGRENPHGQAGSAPPLRSGRDPETRPAPGHPADQTQSRPPSGRVSGGKRSGEHNRPDNEPDQRDPLDTAGNEGDGRVGRVSCTGSATDEAERTLTVSDVLSEINTLGSETAEQASL